MAGIARDENEPARAIAQGEDEGLVHDHVQSEHAVQAMADILQLKEPTDEPADNT